MKKHLKYIDGNSDKFWQIEVLNNEFTVTYGKNGTSGTSQKKSFDSNENCIKAAEKLLAEKNKEKKCRCKNIHPDRIQVTNAATFYILLR